MDSSLLDRFYKGECTEEEVQEVLLWFRSNNIDHDKKMDLYALWQDASHRPLETSRHDAGQLFGKIKDRIGEVQEQQEETVRLWNTVTWTSWAKIAATLLLPLCLIGAMVFYTSHAETAEVAYTSVEAAPGIRKTIHLPDGSTIKLNAGSSVSFAKHFDTDTREIVLHGEAFFEVAKDSLRSFIVHTGNISTQALGTSFNINYRPHATTIEVSLTTGIVKVEKEEQGQKQQLTRLVPGQQLSYNKVSEQYSVAVFNREEVTGWMKGVLYFDKASMDQVLGKLESWYGVNIEVDFNGMENRPWNYTGEYQNESLDKVLEGIGFVKGFTYRQNGKNVKIMLNQPQ